MGLFSGIKKALFGGSKKRARTEENTSYQRDPWDVAVPAVTDYMNQTNQLYANTPMFSEMEMQGYDMLRDTVNSSNGAVGAAITENNKTLSGAYLSPDSNPYLADIAKRMGGEAGARVNASFAGSGRTGSGLAGKYAGQGVAEAVGDVYSQNYQAERGRMSGAVGMAPSLEAGRFLAPQALISAGQNVTARPYDLNAKRGGILTSIAQLGQQGSGNGTRTDYGYHSGLVGKIADSLTNKLFK